MALTASDPALLAFQAGTGDRSCEGVLMPSFSVGRSPFLSGPWCAGARRCPRRSSWAALRALLVDSSCVSGADGLDRGKPRCSAPARPVVGGVVADQGVGNAAGAVGQCAGDDPAVFAAGFQGDGIGFGGRIGVPQADSEIDQRSSQRHTAFAADGSVAALASRFVLHRRQAGGPVDLPWARPATRITQGGSIIADSDHTHPGTVVNVANGL